MTVSVTDMLTGAFVAALELSVSVAAYVPAASPVGSTDTVSTAGAGPLPVTFSQFPPDVVLALGVNGRPEGELLTVSCAAAGVEPSC